jgi:hypothetical protein
VSRTLSPPCGWVAEFAAVQSARRITVTPRGRVGLGSANSPNVAAKTSEPLPPEVDVRARSPMSTA